jgi:hypothetical protein
MTLIVVFLLDLIRVFQEREQFKTLHFQYPVEFIEVSNSYVVSWLRQSLQKKTCVRRFADEEKIHPAERLVMWFRKPAWNEQGLLSRQEYPFGVSFEFIIYQSEVFTPVLKVNSLPAVLVRNEGAYCLDKRGLEAESSALQTPSPFINSVKTDTL